VRGTRLPDDFDEKFRKYRDENDMTNSEAVRSLMRKGFRVEKEEDAGDGSGYTSGPITQLSMMIVAMSLLLSSTAIALVIAGVGVGLPISIAGLLWLTVSLFSLLSGYSHRLDDRLFLKSTCLP